MCFTEIEEVEGGGRNCLEVAMRSKEETFPASGPCASALRKVKKECCSQETDSFSLSKVKFHSKQRLKTWAGFLVTG